MPVRLMVSAIRPINDRVLQVEQAVVTHDMLDQVQDCRCHGDREQEEIIVDQRGPNDVEFTNCFQFVVRERLGLHQEQSVDCLPALLKLGAVEDTTEDRESQPTQLLQPEVM